MLIRIRMYMCRICKNSPYLCTCLECLEYAPKIHKWWNVIEITDVESTDKVKRIKELIEELEGVPVDQQILIFEGVHLFDDDTLQYYGVYEGSVLQILHYRKPVLQEQILDADTFGKSVNKKDAYDEQSLETVSSGTEDVEEDLTQQQPLKIRKVSTNIEDETRSVCKYVQFTNYLAAELKDLPSATANELMDDITRKLLEVKCTVRSRNNEPY